MVSRMWEPGVIAAISRVRDCLPSEIAAQGTPLCALWRKIVYSNVPATMCTEIDIPAFLYCFYGLQLDA
jgi:hypothetical protein